MQTKDKVFLKDGIMLKVCCKTHLRTYGCTNTNFRLFKETLHT